MAGIKLDNHDPAKYLLYALSPAHWCDYLIHLLINQTANLLLSTPLSKQMILQIIRGIEGSLIKFIIVMLILAEWCFW